MEHHHLTCCHSLLQLCYAGVHASLKVWVGAVREIEGARQLLPHRLRRIVLAVREVQFTAYIVSLRFGECDVLVQSAEER